MALVSGVGVPAGAVFDTMELQNDPTFDERGIMQVMEHPNGTFKMPTWPVRVDGKPARSASARQHSAEVLNDWLPRRREIAALKSEGVVGGCDSPLGAGHPRDPRRAPLVVEAQTARKIPRLGYLCRRLPWMPRRARRCSTAYAVSSAIEGGTSPSISGSRTASTVCRSCRGARPTPARRHRGRRRSADRPRGPKGHHDDSDRDDERRRSRRQRPSRRASRVPAATSLLDGRRARAERRCPALKEIRPGAARVAVLWNSAYPEKANEFEETQKAARLLGIQLQPLRIQRADEIEGAIESAVESARTLITLPDPLTNTHGKQIADLAFEAAFRPRCSPAGRRRTDLLRPSYTDLFHRAAGYVDKILKGARSATCRSSSPPNSSW